MARRSCPEAEPSAGLQAYLWVDAKEKVPRELKGRGDRIVGLAFSAEAYRLVTVDQKAGDRVGHAERHASIRSEGAHGQCQERGIQRRWARIVSANHDNSSKVWDARTGQEVQSEPIPKTLPENLISPDHRWFAHMDGNRVRLILVQPDREEIAYRRAQMQPNSVHYREGYLAARVAENEFAARFYLNLFPAAERTALEAKAELDALVPLVRLAMKHWQAEKRDQRCRSSSRSSTSRRPGSVRKIPTPSMP